jgi:hypothetical protein
MGRKNTLLKQREVTRVTRGLLEAVAAAGVTGDIEVHLETGVIKFRMKRELGSALATAETDVNEWNSLL